MRPVRPWDLASLFRQQAVVRRRIVVTGRRLAVLWGSSASTSDGKDLETLFDMKCLGMLQSMGKFDYTVEEMEEEFRAVDEWKPENASA